MPRMIEVQPPHLFHHVGVERHQAIVSVIILQYVERPRHDPQVAVPVRLEFNHQRNLARHLLQKLGQCLHLAGTRP